MSEAGLRAPRTWRSPGRRVGEPGWERGAPSDQDEELLREAREQFRRVYDWEAKFRQAFINDVRFANGDSDNHWQWPEGLFSQRDGQDRPALTVNKTRQHVLQIVNDARQNKPQVRITPVSDEATKEAADVFEGVVRHIEYVSNAQTAYDTATEHQVQGGIGWWRVITDYEAADSFDQAIFIRRVKDPLSVYMDPDIQEADGSDARFAFVVDELPREEFEAKYPEYVDRVPQAGWAEIDGGWLDEDHVRVAEYYRRVEDADTLFLLPDGSTLRESDIEGEEARALVRQTAVRTRQVNWDRIEWVKIVGGLIVERNEWPGRYIPLVRVIGEEQVIEGRLERKGHVRALKDPQRIYNYWTSSAVESVALQSKTPYIAAAESIENYQHYWDTANTENHSVLPFNAMDDAGRQLPPPQRQDPPQMAQAYVQGIQISQQEMMMASGQYQPTMGQPAPNEVSGRAIQLRQRQGDNATYHFIDHLSIAIRFTGRILIDLIPKVYDTPRVLRILQLDGSIDRVQLDPNAPQALTMLQAPNQQQAGVAPTPQQLAAQSVIRIFNPAVGQYEVQADVGPAYQTRREEAFNAFLQVVNTAPMLMNVVGDLLFKAADFPMAEELAERLQRMVPPQALGTGPGPQEQALQQQLQAAQAHVALLGEKLSVAEMKLRARDEQKDIDAYQAVTQRMGTLLNAEKTDSAYADGSEMRALITQMVRDALQQSGMAPVSNAALSDALAADNAMNPGSPMGVTAPPQGGQPPPPGMPVPPGVTNGQMAALTPIRAPMAATLPLGRRGPV